MVYVIFRSGTSAQSSHVSLVKFARQGERRLSRVQSGKSSGPPDDGPTKSRLSEPSLRLPSLPSRHLPHAQVVSFNLHDNTHNLWSLCVCVCVCVCVCELGRAHV